VLRELLDPAVVVAAEGVEGLVFLGLFLVRLG
jgi:hypothetical protein